MSILSENLFHYTVNKLCLESIRWSSLCAQEEYENGGLFFLFFCINQMCSSSLYQRSSASPLLCRTGRNFTGRARGKWVIKSGHAWSRAGQTGCVRQRPLPLTNHRPDLCRSLSRSLARISYSQKHSSWMNIDTSVMENKQLKPHRRINSAVKRSRGAEKHMNTSASGEHETNVLESLRRQWPTQADG